MINLERIVEQCRKHNKQAQFQLYNWLSPILLGLAMRYMQNRDEAEDVMQDTFVKIFTQLNKFKGEGSFEGWARRIAVNTALTALKKRNRIYFERNLTIVETIEFETEEQISLADILSCMDALPPGYRTIINLFVVEEFSHREIGEKLDIAESTSRSQYARARQVLMKLLKEKNSVISRKNA